MKMDVVGYQTPAEEADSRVAQILPQEPEVGLAVLIAREGFAAVHATLGDAAGNPRAAGIGFVAECAWVSIAPNNVWALWKIAQLLGPQPAP